MELEDHMISDQSRHLDEVSSKSTEYVKKKKLLIYQVICAVLLCALVVVSLGLGLGLGLQQEQTSCRHKCHNPPGASVRGCRCDSHCQERGDCCWDYEDTCLEPARSWRCSKFRCGETRLPGSRCACAHDCRQRRDCCANYYSTCAGETPWVEEPCEAVETPQCPEGVPRPPLILFSMDGFRAEYLHTWSSLLPNTAKFKACGTHPKYMRAVYPTKTFPNHYTIVTGLYPESHGIVDNNMYDVDLDKHFSLSGPEKLNPQWWKGQPIWLTAMDNLLRAGTFFWPGSDVPINGSYPTYYHVYNGSVPYEQRIAGVLEWLDYPQPERPHFYTLYIEEPDSSGHSSGPVSGSVLKGLQAADEALGMLMDGLRQRNLHKCVNIIIVSDHGMEATNCQQLEFMTDYFQQVDFHIYSGPAAGIRAANVPEDYFSFDSEGIVRNLTCQRSPQHFKPYLVPELPKRLHYANSLRIPRAHLLLRPRWQAARDNTYTFCDGGNHGYDNKLRSMEAIFLAYGPSFKEKTEVEAFENIELYNLMCDLLEIIPTENNGTHGSLNHLLKKPFYSPSHAREQTAPSACPVSHLIPTDDLGCSCDTITDVSAVNQRLNLTTEEVTEAHSYHLPYGRPRLLQQEKTYCLLSHHQYVSAYSYDIFMPLWTAYTLDKPENTSALPPTAADCLRADVRIPAARSQNCSDSPEALTFARSFLYPPHFSSPAAEQYDALLTTNIVPMHRAFREIWDYFHDVLLQQYARERNGVNVVSGPVFDYNYDGHFDTPEDIKQHVNSTGIPVPTHYFVVLTSCKNKSHTPLSCSGSLDVLSFIIPHRADNSESCAEGKAPSEWVEERVWAHSARVRDVELLAGLDFYQDSKEPLAELLRLKTFLPILDTET